MSIKGLSKKNAEVAIHATEDGELQVRAIVESELEHASTRGDSYCWPSADSDINAGDTRLFIKNTSDKFLVLSRAVFSPANVACKYDIGVGALTTTPTGTTVTAINMNQKFTTQSEDYVAYDDETAVDDATKMFGVMVNATDSKEVPLDGIILGKNHYIQINQETESTSGQVAVFGHYETELV